MQDIYNWVFEHKTVVAALAFIGFASVASQLITFVSVFAQTFILSGTSLSKFGAKKGAYAVVTGATDGIGREFSLQLAKAGFNMVLVSRSQEKLEALAQEISNTYKVSTIVHTIDFSQTNQPHVYESLGQKLQGVQVGVLVNNVGRSHEMPVYFTDTSEEEMNSIINININGTLDMTKLILPKMLERKKGLILNMGSFAGSFASPMLATYSGSKAFLAYWSQSLAEEYKKQGITVQLVNTYFVVSNMSKIRRPSISTPTPKVFVKSTLSRIGLPCGSISRPFTSTPYWAHSIADWVIALLITPSMVISYTHRLHTDIRKRALRKKEREAKKQ